MSRQDEETMDGGSKTMDGAGSTQSQQQHHSGFFLHFVWFLLPNDYGPELIVNSRYHPVD